MPMGTSFPVQPCGAAIAKATLTKGPSRTSRMSSDCILKTVFPMEKRFLKFLSVSPPLKLQSDAQALYQCEGFAQAAYDSRLPQRYHRIEERGRDGLPDNRHAASVDQQAGFHASS